MSRTVIVPKQLVQDILSTLTTLQKDIADIKATIDVVPKYGSSAWWKHSDKKAKDDIKNKRYTTLKSAKDVDDYFASL